MVADLLGSLQIFLDVMQMWCLCELSKKLFVALGHRKKKKKKKRHQQLESSVDFFQNQMLRIMGSGRLALQNAVT